MKMFCECGNEMKTGKEYDREACSECIALEDAFAPVRETRRPPQDHCPHCKIARQMGEVAFCRCMV